MSFRIENKYKLEVGQLNKLYEFIYKNSGKILHKKRLINSIYLDNSELSAYNDSIEGTVPRKKIRIRSYPEENKGDFNFEIKINSNEGKYKISNKKKNLNKILKNGFYDEKYGQCFANIEVSYLREYFELYGIRITVDNKIKYSEFDKKKIIPTDELAILEVKTNNIDQLNYIEEKFYFEKTRFSKYCNAIEQVYNLNS